MERRLAAILAADVVGYTGLMGADETGTLRRLTELRQQVLEPLIAEHHGRVVKLMGDGLLVEFASVVDAVTCAVGWQNSVTAREADADEDRRLQFRIGINLGDVIVEGDDIHGDGVNIAARLEGLAEPGGTCLSGDAYHQVKGKVEADFEDMGEQDLKNVAEPVRVYRIAGDRSETVASSPGAPASNITPCPMDRSAFPCDPAFRGRRGRNVQLRNPRIVRRFFCRARLSLKGLYRPGRDRHNVRFTPKSRHYRRRVAALPRD